MHTFKEECLWLKEWSCPLAFISALEAWVTTYNEHYLHSALGYKPPRQFERDYYNSPSPPFLAALLSAGRLGAMERLAVGSDQNLLPKETKMAERRVDKIQVGVINASNFVKKDLEEKHLTMQDIIDALQEQVEHHFGPAWGISAEVKPLDDSGPVPCVQMVKRPRLSSSMSESTVAPCTPSKSWWLLIVDNSDAAGVLGYRDTTHEGLPLAKVFAETAEGYGLPWTVTASHELLEMLADPGMSLAAFRPTGKPTEASGRLYAYEVCDPCGNDQYLIGEKDISVANFVYPAWFQWFHDPKWFPNANNQFMHKYYDEVTAPFQLRPGGQISVLDIPSGSGWYQIFEDKEPISDHMLYNMRPRVGSRRERRRMVAQPLSKSGPGGAGG
jgi:hypothetical protein